MNWRTKSAAYLLAASFLTGGLAACTKGNELNVDLPGTATIGTNFVDLPLTAFNVVQQPIQTLKAQHYLVGRLRDELTGTTEARAVLNLLATSANDSLPGHFVVAGGPDSVVVSLAYDQVYGSATQPAQLDVLELSQPLDERTVYNSTSQVALNPAAIATGLAVPLGRTRAVRQAISGSPSDSVTVQVPDRAVQLVVQRQGKNTNPAYPNVSSARASSLFRQLQVFTLTQAQLNAQFAGLVLAPSAGYTGAVLSFSRVLNGAVVVYFHELGTGKRHSYQLPFGPSASGGTGAGSPADPRYFTQLKTDFVSGSALNSLTPGTRLAVAASSGVGYVQEGTGLGLAVQFNSAAFVDKLTKPGIAINRAELILPIKPYSNALYGNPATLYAIEVDGRNNTLQRTDGINLTDRVVQADGLSQIVRNVNGESAATIVNPNSTNAYYSLLITSYLQAYLNNASANTLPGPLPDALLLTPALSTASSLTLNRAAIQADKATLRVYYSQLRQ